jgi:DNA-binding transcriptional ArsR family regulator
VNAASTVAPESSTSSGEVGLNDDLAVIASADAASVAIEPLRSRILAALGEPGSASSVAEALGQTRQKINYHLRILEEHGLVRLVEERPRRGLTERVMIATARSYVISPDVLGRSASDPTRTRRLSTHYLLALAARIVREVSSLSGRADQAGKPLPTMALDTDLRFASPGDRAKFTTELGEAVATVAGRYHDERAADGRWYRLVVASYPRPESAKQPSEGIKK